MRLITLSLGIGIVAVALMAGGGLVPSARASTPPSGTPGIIETFAGGGSDTANDIPALEALVVPVGLAVAPNGDLYMSEFGCRIRKVSDGMISAVVGGATCGYSGDGGPAVDAEMSRPGALTFDADGNLYFADQANCAVRRVDADTGIITTVAGHPPCDYSSYADPFGITATDAHLGHTGSLAVDSTGIYVSEPDMCRVDRISSGVIERYVGAPPTVTPPWTCIADGDGPALTQHLDEIDAVAFDDDGNLLLAGWGHCNIRKVAGGVLSTVTSGGLPRGIRGGNPVTGARGPGCVPG